MPDKPESKIAEKAMKYRQAAERGDAYAQCSLGECYYYGDGVPQDFDEAGKWYRKSAEQGYIGAQYRLGDFYFFGKGVALDLGESLEWYRKAARQGYEMDLAQRSKI
jgi:TPR repeat protein